MRKKIRVVSIILCLSIILGLLPTEQVFAATTDGPHTNYLDYLGVQTWDWGYVTRNKETGTLYRKSNVGVTEMGLEGASLDIVKAGDDAAAEVLHNESKPGSFTMAYADGIDTVAKGFHIYRDVPHIWSSAGAGTDYPQIVSGLEGASYTFVTQIEDRQLGEMVDVDGQMVPALLQGDANVYTYEFYWVNNNGKSLSMSKSNQEWLYQRIWCDYNLEYDVFIYTSIAVLQNQDSSADFYVLSVDISKDFNAVGIACYTNAYADDKMTGSDYSDDWMMDRVIEEQSKMLASFLEEEVGQNAVLNLLERSCPDYNKYFTFTETTTYISCIKKDALAVALGTMGMIDDVSVFSKGLLGAIRFKSRDGRNEASTLMYTKMAHVYMTAMAGNTQGIINNKYTINSSPGPFVEYPDKWSLKSPADATDDCLVDAFDLEEYRGSTTIFGISEKKDLDKPVSVYEDLFVRRAYSAIRVIEMSVEEGSTIVNSGYTLYDGKSDATAYRDTLKDLSGLYNLLKGFGIEVDFKSDTGFKISSILTEGLINNMVPISYSKSDYKSAGLNWRSIYETQSDIVCSSYSDLVYLLTLVEYLKSLGALPNATGVQITLDSKAKINVYFDDVEEIASVKGTGYWGKFLDEDSTECVEKAGATMSIAMSEVLSTAVATNLDWSSAFDVDSSKITTINKILHNAKWSVNCVKGTDFYRVFTPSGDGITNVLETDKYVLTEEDKGYLVDEMSDAEDNFTVTGTVTSHLTYGYPALLYALYATSYGVGEGSVSGIPESLYIGMSSEFTYNRAAALAGTKYQDSNGASVDYVPRLPTTTFVPNSSIRNLLYNTDYAANVMDWSTLSDEELLSSIHVEDWANGNPEVLSQVVNTIKNTLGDNATALEWAKSGVYDDLPEGYLNLFRAIINIYDICNELYDIDAAVSDDLQVFEESNLSYEYRGQVIAERWSPAINAYYSLYVDEEFKEFFDTIRANLTKIIAADFSASSVTEPLGFVIKTADESLSAQWKYGYAMSSMHVPFQTNLYEVSSLGYLEDDTEWITEFYYKYGFYRKALYINTSSTSIVDGMLGKTTGGTRIATLGDLLNYDRDIELFVDDNFYNSSLLKEQLEKYIEHAKDSSAFGSMSDACNVTAEAILKTGGYSTYDSTIQQRVMPFDFEYSEEEAEKVEEQFKYDSFLIARDEIVGEEGFLSRYEYSIQQTYGVVSAIYRSPELYNLANKSSVAQEPVFQSSKNAQAVSANNYSAYRMFYNYMMLSAMEETIEEQTTLLVDYDAPIFIDIFGNIVTMDGYVIIPAASNATLMGNDYSPYSMGFATYAQNVPGDVYENCTDSFYDWLYGLDYSYAIGIDNVNTAGPNFRAKQQDFGGGYLFIRDDGSKTMGITTLSDGVASVSVDWENPNTKIAALKSLLFSCHYISTANSYNDRMINLIVEVLRGAPIEQINMDAEGISSANSISKIGAFAAYMFEQFMSAFSTDSNGTEYNVKFSATMNVLDIFHIESAEKVALLAVKILLIGFLIMLGALIVADASVGKMPISAVKKIVITCVLTGTCIALLPVLTEFSLTKTTQIMLQREAAELLAMQAQRDAYGIEIGTVQSKNTESSTDIIVKVGELDVQWHDLLLYSVYSDVGDSFRSLYNKEADSLPLAKQKYTFTSGKTIYMNLSKVMDSTIVQYDANYGLMTNTLGHLYSQNDLTATYMLPYYVFLDQLLANVNYYNKVNGVQPVVYTVNADGTIRTQDMCYAYFHSDDFLSDDYDVLDVYNILGVNTHKLNYCSYFSDKDIEEMTFSGWYPLNAGSDTLSVQIDQFYKVAKEYIITNSDMMNYVSDSAFLKSYAMYLSLQFNSIFMNGQPDAYELKCVDTKDLLRYVISEPKDVYKFANRTLPRYAYEACGTPGVILAFILYFTFCITNALKVIAYVLTYIISILSIIYHSLFKKEEGYSVYGFFILIGEITLLNLIYAVCLKVMMNLTRWGVAGPWAMLIAIVIQLLLLAGFVMLTLNGVKNVKQLGQKELHFMSNVANHFNREMHVSKSTPPSDRPEQTVAVLQAHDFSRQVSDNFTETRDDPSDLLAHDRRRETGQIEETE